MPGAPAATPRWVALLRGVNVGKGQRVPMADWKAQLEGLGATDVRTLLNSGNAVFSLAGRTTPQALATRIHDAIAQHLGLDVPVQVWTAQTFRAVVEDNPLAAETDDPSRLLVVFPGHGHAAEDFASLAPLLAPTERLHIGARAAVLWCADGILASRAAADLLGRRRATATTRNWATVLKIAAAL